MGFVVAILITLAVMGSILWVMPSPREKRIIEMRQKAMSLGLKVRLLDQTMMGKFFPWCEDYRQYVLYELPVLAGRKKVSQTLVVRLSEGFVPHELDEQHVVQEKVRESTLVDRLPESREALIYTPGGISLLWKEDKGSEVLAELKEVLEECLEAALENSL